MNTLPWWIAAIALSAVTLGYWMALKRPLGVSGCWARVVMWKNDRALGDAEAPFRDNPDLFKDALMDATIRQFGEQRVKEYLAARRAGTPGGVAAAAAPVVGSVPNRVSWTAHLTFLLMLVVGGFVAALLQGGLHVRFTLGASFAHLMGAGFSSWMVLFVGGGLVGFGTQLAGGCTSGHGLSGCSRLVPASLLAIGTSFLTAVVVSMLINFGAGAGL